MPAKPKKMACCSAARAKMKKVAFTKAKLKADTGASGPVKKAPAKKAPAKKAAAKKAKGCMVCGKK